MTISGHLDPQDLTRYVLRRLSPAKLLAVDDHIHECEDCRCRVAAAAKWSRTLADLTRQTNRVRHLTYEQLTNYAEGRLSERQRARVDRHLDTCGVCRAELQDVRG